MSFTTGNLVRARGRDWVVLPGSDDELVLLRPLGGAQDEVAGVLTSLELVEPATFALPAAAGRGDDRSARLLRDALRLGFRSSAGPFRCAGSLNFEPRPYQLVPLLMALRQDTVRLLIADDVGVGKSAEALLIAAELLAQGEIRRFAVLCPPHLAGQWQQEVTEKFQLAPAVVLPATAAKLERDCRLGETLFDRHDITVVSTEYIKADRRRFEFLRTAPELVIVEEAHECTPDAGPRAGRHQRYELVRNLAGDPGRHLVHVTATPHAGKGEPWRALLATLDPQLADLPDDLSGDHNRRNRERVARHVIQRTRGDLAAFLDRTVFPEVSYAAPEPTYKLSEPLRALTDAAFGFATETVRCADGTAFHQRVRWWSALALLRSIASSPAAAVATLENRARAADAASADAADAAGQASLSDTTIDDEDGATTDDVPGSVLPADDPSPGLKRRLRELRRLAGGCFGDADTKLVGLITILRGMIAGGFRPIVFCRFIPTAAYLAGQLQAAFPAAETRAITGLMPASERPEAIAALGEHPRRILVATDCLSEGINLQALFDAVVHYDLLWNPSKMAQREGRVSRLNQPSPTVRICTYYGSDNRIDDLVLDVLQRRHVRIRASTGVYVPVPGDPGRLIESFARRLLAQPGGFRGEQLTFEGMAEQEEVIADWEAAAGRERRSRSLFAQEGIKQDEVAAELARMRAAVGSGPDVRRFVADAAAAHRGQVIDDGTAVTVDLAEAPAALRDLIGAARLRARFEPPAGGGEVLLTRTHPFVAGLARYTLDSALDDRRAGPASRAGVMRTAEVSTRTTIVLARYRFDLRTEDGGQARQLLAEDSAVLAFTGDPAEPGWLSDARATALLAATPTGNVSPQQAGEVLETILREHAGWLEGIAQDARRKAQALLEDHRRVRRSSQRRIRGLAVEPRLPPDVIGVYVLLPDPRASR